MSKETSLDAEIRPGVGKSSVKKIISAGKIPSIIYGLGEDPINISLDKILVQKEINAGGFLTRIFSLNIDGKNQDVLPREIAYNVLSDDPTHVDFLRVVPGVKIKIEVPVQFINHEKSPGLKRGGVLNIVRRKIELNCPSEKIPKSIVIDLDGVDIGESFKISSVKLEEGVMPTIIGRDFVIATLAAPTVMKEPEKPAEAEVAEGEEGAEGAEAAATDGEKPAVEDDKKNNNNTVLYRYHNNICSII
mgnify:CR=1 FL=1